MATQRSRCVQHTRGDELVHKVSQGPCFSSALHDSREQMLGDSLHTQRKKKNLCTEQTAALSTSGLEECGCLGGGKEARREGDY